MLKLLLMIFITVPITLLSADNGIIDSEFKLTSLTEQFRNTIAPMVEDKLYNGKYQFVVLSQWNKTYSNKSAGASFFIDPNKGKFGVAITGWVARKVVNEDAILSILCHELGHHFYGAGNEQESDYFVTSQCLPWLWKKKFRSERAIHAVSLILNLRQWIWLEMNIKQQRINRIINCRLKIFKDGIFQKGFTKCSETGLGF